MRAAGLRALPRPSPGAPEAGAPRAAATNASAAPLLADLPAGTRPVADVLMIEGASREGPPRTTWDDLRGLAARNWDAIMVADPPARPGDDDLAALQRALRPGGALIMRSPRPQRRLVRRLRRYFEGGAPTRRQRFRPVRRDRRRRRIVAVRRGPGLLASHFDTLAGAYDDEIPAHVAEAFLARKLDVLQRNLPSPPTPGHGPPRLRALELGCGLGDHARGLRSRTAGTGIDVVASDAFPKVAAEARRRGTPDVVSADAQRLPFCDAAFDAAYTINMMHHLKRGEQEAALAEAARVLRPGGRLVVFEINTRNPLFRFYMRHIFPRTRGIDRGDEEFIHPRRWPLGPRFAVRTIEYFTFLPDFVPRRLMPLARRMERLLEASPLRRGAIHYAAVLEVLP